MKLEGWSSIVCYWLIIIIIIWLSLFSPCDRSICGRYVPIRTKISKANAHFAALNLFISKKKVWRRLWNVCQAWGLGSSNILICVYLWTKPATKKPNRNLIELRRRFQRPTKERWKRLRARHNRWVHTSEVSRLKVWQELKYTWGHERPLTVISVHIRIPSMLEAMEVVNQDTR